MKKRIMLLLIVLSSLVVTLIPLHAASQENVKQWDAKYGVSTDKIWNIAFNTKMDPSSFNNDNVYVINEETQEKHPITIELTEDGKVLTVSPNKPYAFHQFYTLHVGQAAMSQEAVAMKEAIKMQFFISKPFVVSSMDYTPVASYDSLQEAVAKVNPETQVVMKDGKVIWMKSGIVRTDRFTLVYDSNTLKNNTTYVAEHTEMEYLSSSENAIGIRLAGRSGYVAPEDVTLIPTSLINGQRSYYKNIDGDLHHYVYRNGSFGIYKYGKAPDTMKNGEIAYSWDGTTFKGQTYSFNNQVNLREPSTVTAEQIDAYIKAQKPDSPLIGLGQTFIDMQEEHNINALYLMAHAIHESAWGGSKIAKEKNNLYGINATDSNPYGNADSYVSYEASVIYAAEFISEKYLTEGTFRYNGMFLGNKASGMNVKYASDPFWGQKIAGHMYRAEQWLSENEVQTKEEQ